MEKKHTKLTNIGMMGYNMLSDEDLEMLLAKERAMSNVDFNLLSDKDLGLSEIPLTH